MRDFVRNYQRLIFILISFIQSIGTFLTCSSLWDLSLPWLNEIFTCKDLLGPVWCRCTSSYKSVGLFSKSVIIILILKKSWVMMIFLRIHCQIITCFEINSRLFCMCTQATIHHHLLFNVTYNSLWICRLSIWAVNNKTMLISTHESTMSYRNSNSYRSWCLSLTCTRACCHFSQRKPLLSNFNLISFMSLSFLISLGLLFSSFSIIGHLLLNFF